MKLVMCKICRDIFNLDYRVKTCGCGQVSGRYTDQRMAEVTGDHVAIAMGSGSLDMAFQSVAMRADLMDWREDKRFNEVIKLYHDMRALVPGIILTWARQSSGMANPHTQSKDQ